jgi:hypothetical protein
MDLIWSSPIPDGYSRADMQQKHLIPPNMKDDGSGLNKRVKLSGKEINNPDFINILPPMDTILSIPRTKSAIATMIN